MARPIVPSRLNAGMTTEILGSTSVGRFMPQPTVAASRIGLQPYSPTSRCPRAPQDKSRRRAPQLSATGPLIVHRRLTLRPPISDLCLSRDNPTGTLLIRQPCRLRLFGEVPSGDQGISQKSRTLRSSGFVDIQGSATEP